jgi:aspartate-semialdehyde dehydrogenase
MSEKKYKIAVAGVTGAVGQEMLKVLEQRDFPLSTLKPLASVRSAGSKIEFKGEKLKVELLTKDSFKDCNIALFSAGGNVSKEFAPIAANSGCIVIDNTNAFRMEQDVPLVVPEVNSDDIKLYTNKNIIANPNCSTIQMVVVLKPIHDKAIIKRVVVSTYQAVSGTGKEAIEELFSQTKAILNFSKFESKVYPHQIAFNALPHIDVFLENGYSREEMKMVNETKKILGDDKIKVTATTVRIPVVIGHSESLNIETEKKITKEEIRGLLSSSSGVTVIDDLENNKYPLATMAVGEDDVFVGRIREDESIEKGINLWIVADNLRKGAALNAVQIAEILVKNYL